MKTDNVRHFKNIRLTQRSSTHETKRSRMDQVKFVEDSLKNILLGPFLNTLAQIRMEVFLNIYLLFTRSKPRSL